MFTKQKPISKILDRVYEGEEVILAKGGRPYAKLVPLNEGKSVRWDLCQAKFLTRSLSPSPRTSLNDGNEGVAGPHALLWALVEPDKLS